MFGAPGGFLQEYNDLKSGAVTYFKKSNAFDKASSAPRNLHPKATC
jgi:hypothetical protein